MLERPRSRVEDDPRDEPLTQSVSQPDQLTRGVAGRRRVGFHFDADDASVRPLDKSVGLSAPLLGAKVEQASVVARGHFAVQLTGDEGAAREPTRRM